jgi:hypothetical protein
VTITGRRTIHLEDLQAEILTYTYLLRVYLSLLITESRASGGLEILDWIVGQFGVDASFAA